MESMGPAAVVDPTPDAGIAEAARETSPQPEAAKGPSGDESPMLLDPKATFLTGVAISGK